jgi:hypothetical protein
MLNGVPPKHDDMQHVAFVPEISHFHVLMGHIFVDQLRDSGTGSSVSSLRRILLDSKKWRLKSAEDLLSTSNLLYLRRGALGFFFLVLSPLLLLFIFIGSIVAMLFCSSTIFVFVRWRWKYIGEKCSLVLRYIWHAQNKWRDVAHWWAAYSHTYVSCIQGSNYL